MLNVPVTLGFAKRSTFLGSGPAKLKNILVSKAGRPASPQCASGKLGHPISLHVVDENADTILWVKIFKHSAINLAVSDLRLGSKR